MQEACLAFTLSLRNDDAMSATHYRRLVNFFVRKERQKANKGPDVTWSEFYNTHSDYDDDDDTVEHIPF
jgi:hypothetical protein